jgi:hypothetical protein
VYHGSASDHGAACQPDHGFGLVIRSLRLIAAPAPDQSNGPVRFQRRRPVIVIFDIEYKISAK